MRSRTVWIAALALTFAACGDDGSGSTIPAAQAAPPASIDSVQPADAALARFRADLEPVDRLRGGAESPEALVTAIAAAVHAADTAALERLTVDRAEFAYLWYPTSPLAHPPYELPAELAWFRLQQQNRTGVLRLLRELGGQSHSHSHSQGPVRLDCTQPPHVQGESRIHTGCSVQIGERAPLRIFGSLLEHGGAVKVLSWANDF